MRYFGFVWGGRWFVFLVEPCAAGKDVRLCKSGKDWCQVSMCVWLAGPRNVQIEGVTALHLMQDIKKHETNRVCAD